MCSPQYITLPPLRYQISSAGYNKSTFPSSSLLFHLSIIPPLTTSSLPVTQIDRQIRLDTVDSGGSNCIRGFGRGRARVKWHAGLARSPFSLHKRCHWHNLTGRLLSSPVEVFQQVICLSFVCQLTTAPRLPQCICVCVRRRACAPVRAGENACCCVSPPFSPPSLQQPSFR